MATLDEAARAGKEVDQILQGPHLRAAIERVKKQYFEQWVLTADDETQKRDQLWMAYNLVDKVWGDLCAVAANGRAAQRELDEIERVKRESDGSSRQD